MTTNFHDSFRRVSVCERPRSINRPTAPSCRQTMWTFHDVSKAGLAVRRADKQAASVTQSTGSVHRCIGPAIWSVSPDAPLHSVRRQAGATAFAWGRGSVYCVIAALQFPFRRRPRLLVVMRRRRRECLSNECVLDPASQRRTVHFKWTSRAELICPSGSANQRQSVPIGAASPTLPVPSEQWLYLVFFIIEWLFIESILIFWIFGILFICRSRKLSYIILFF